MIFCIFVQVVWWTNPKFSGGGPRDGQNGDGEGVLLCVYQPQGKRLSSLHVYWQSCIWIECFACFFRQIAQHWELCKNNKLSVKLTFAATSCCLHSDPFSSVLTSPGWIGVLCGSINIQYRAAQLMKILSKIWTLMKVKCVTKSVIIK